MSLFQKNYSIANVFDKRADAVVALDDSLRFTKTLPDNFFRLIISSPPYNIGKVYEKQVSIEDYLKQIDPQLVIM